MAKRSEALNIIFNNLQSARRNDEVAMNILDDLEGLGILPPHEESYRMYTYFGFNGGHYDPVKFEWEKEDE